MYKSKSDLMFTSQLSLQLLTHFIPKLCESRHGGHFVTIQHNAERTVHPFLDSRAEIHELIRCLTHKCRDNEQTNPVCLSTVLLPEIRKCGTWAVETNFVEKIIDGIENRKSIVRITTENRSLIEYLIKLSRKYI